jgi:hypothetical protein
VAISRVSTACNDGGGGGGGSAYLKSLSLPSVRVHSTASWAVSSRASCQSSAGKGGSGWKRIQCERLGKRLGTL